MNISEVKVRRLYPKGHLCAVVSVTLDEQIVIHDIKIFEKEGGLFLAMPSRRDETGRFRDVVHPIHAQARRELEEAVLSEYNLEKKRVFGEIL